MKNLALTKSVASIILFLAWQNLHAELSIGDTAPKLQVGKWIQGESVSGFDSNHVYVVEFWATWCEPCQECIPHLNELAKKFEDKGVIFIGQDVWDSDDSVAPFVKKMGDKMTYRVALDDKTQYTNGFMSENWWKRKVDNHTIPNAFIVNKQSVIAWIGHPMNLEEKTLNEILSGQYSLPQAADNYKNQQQENQKIRELNQKLIIVNEAIDKKDWDTAAATLAEMDKISTRYQTNYAWIHLKVFLGQKKYDEAYKFADNFSKNSYQLDLFAWTIATQDGVEKRNLALAQKLSEQANAISRGTNSSVLNTVARIQFMQGDKQQAIATEQKAVTSTSDDEIKAICQKTLAAYEQGKLPDEKN